LEDLAALPREPICAVVGYAAPLPSGSDMPRPSARRAGDEGDNVLIPSRAILHRRGDPSRRAIGDRPERIIGKMRVDLGGSGLFVSEHLTHHEERIPVRYGEGCEGVAQIM
jgi:hypothetical protein